MTKKWNDGVLQLAVRITFCVILVLALLYFAFFCLTRPGISLEEQGVRTLTGFVTTGKDGQEEAVDPDKSYYDAENRLFEMRGTLPEDLREDIREVYLLFFCVTDTEITVDGNTVFSFSFDRDAHVIGGGVKSFYQTIPLSPENAGQEIVFRQVMDGLHSSRGPKLMTGTATDILRYLFRVFGVTFVMALMLMGISVIVMLFGFNMRMRVRHPVDIVTISFAIFMTAGWIITDSYFYPFVFGHNHIDGWLSYILCMLLPVPYLSYMDKLQHGRHRKVYLGLQVLPIAATVIITALHISRVAKFYDFLTVINAILVGNIVCVAVILIRELKGGYAKAYHDTALGLVGLMLTAVIEIVLVLAPGLINNGQMIIIGLMFLLAFAVSQQMEDSRLAEIEKQKALEISNAKTAFLASMSHEIRTPINSILGMNEIILRESKDPEITAYAGTVQRSGRVLLSLINDVLDFSRIEAGKLEIIEEEYRLADLLADTAAIAKEQAEQKGLAFEINVARGLPAGLKSDEVRIKQILMNLISNAVKYTDEGKITIDAGGEYINDELFALRFDVRDTGRGIREEDKKQLFKAFTRNDLQRNRNIEGTGLGPAIVKRITDAMEGTIEVESEYGRGSVFTVTLPQKVTDHSRVPRDLDSAAAMEIQTRNGCGFTAPDAVILAVDDNRPNLNIVSAFLKDTKAQVDLCASGTEALEKCREKRYDLILLDHMMPDPDGIRTLEMIRTDAESRNPDVPAVVLTANAVAGSREMYLAAGFADYLAKPLDAAKLEETVRKYLPAGKVREQAGEEDDVMEFEAAGQEEAEGTANPEKYRAMGLDPETALTHTGGSTALLDEVLADIAANAKEKAKTLRECAEKKDLEGYRIAAHSVKGLMATVGANAMSEEAREHEYAARDGKAEFVAEKGKAFADKYEEFCRKLRG